MRGVRHCLLPHRARWARGAVVAAALLLAPSAGAQEETNNGVGIGPSERLTLPPSPSAPGAPVIRAPGPSHLLGDWAGGRTYLVKHGVALDIDYTTETLANIDGGRRKGATYAHQIGLQADIDGDALAGLTGFSTHAIFVNRAGSNSGPEYVGDTVIQPQEIYGAGFGQAVKLVYLYVEERLFDGHLDLAAGRLSVGADFAASPFYCNFMTLTICGHPRALTSNPGFSDWPTASWGARARARPTDETYFQFGLYEAKPFPPGGHSGFDWSIDEATGETIAVEAAYQPSLGEAALPGHYKVGASYDTSRYADFYEDTSHAPRAVTGGAPRQRDGRGSLWVTFDQMLVRNGRNHRDGITLLAAYAHNDPTTSLFDQFVWGGVVDKGFWAAHPQHQVGLGVTYYRVSNRLTKTEELQLASAQPLENGALGVQRHAVVVEANYNFPVVPGAQLQPEIEYFVHPGGAAAVANAFAIGMKTHVDF